jgi:hypothetical protein
VPDLSQVIQGHFKIPGDFLFRAVTDGSHSDSWNSRARQMLHERKSLHFGRIPRLGQPGFLFNRSNDSLEAKKPLRRLSPAFERTLKEPRIAPDTFTLMRVPHRFGDYDVTWSQFRFQACRHAGHDCRLGPVLSCQSGQGLGLPGANPGEDYERLNISDSRLVNVRRSKPHSPKTAYPAPRSEFRFDRKTDQNLPAHGPPTRFARPLACSFPSA